MRAEGAKGWWAYPQVMSPSIGSRLCGTNANSVSSCVSDHDGGHRARAVEVPVFLGPDCQHQHANVADVVAKRAEHYVSSLLTEMSEHEKKRR